MEIEVKVHKQEGYIEFITRGVADSESSLQMADTIKEKMRQNRITKALIDHSQIEAVSGEIIEIYNRPKKLSIIGIMRIKVAEIIKPEHQEHFRFFETVCRNQGFSISIFQEREEALVWLSGKRPAGNK